jgi:hypothetical protein
MTTPNKNDENGETPKSEETDNAAVAATDATEGSTPSNLSAMEAAVIEMLKNTNLQAQRQGQQLSVVQQLQGMGGVDEGATKHAFWDTQVRFCYAHGAIEGSKCIFVLVCACFS